jgi:Ser-Thr-rich glycosyl-phosphatidyl-inositol-anchored membrane family
MRGLLLFLLVFSFLVTSAQTVTIKKVELAGDKVIVHYDLEDSNPNNEYKLDLYSSKDNFTNPLTKVKGDIGPEVKPGVNRKVEWSIREEYGPYKGKIALEIRGKAYVPFVRLQDFTDPSFKRGSSQTLNWKPGNTNPINIELFKGGQRIGGEMGQPNNGSHTFYIPAKAKPGKDYRIKISDARNSEEVIFSDYFQVKPKVPTLLKILPIVAIGGGAAVVAGGGGGGGPTTPDGPADLPEPPTRN